VKTILEKAYDAYYKQPWAQHLTPNTPIVDLDNGYIIFYNVNGLLGCWKIKGDKIRQITTKKGISKINELYFDYTL